MSDETTLLPCPFCGGEAHISDDYSSKRGMVYSVWHDCPAGGGYHPYGQGVGVLQVTSAWFSSREEAIAAWNTRAELGSGTCKLIDTTSPGNDDYWNSAKCSECGAEFTCAIFGRDRRLPDANYCPNCRRKVVG